MSKGGGVWGVPKILEHFSWTFDHFRLFKSSGRKDGVQKPNTFSKANRMKYLDRFFKDMASLRKEELWKN